MNIFPLPFEERMKTMLGAEAEAFFQALNSDPPVSIRFNPGKSCQAGELFPDSRITPVSWCPQACYLDSRPVFTLDPCFHGGAYYVQEASSMFLDHVLRQILPAGPLRVLDLCAAPGGKSTLLASALPPDSLLIANEVIRNRASILKENIIKWGQDRVVVTRNDPADFSSLRAAFDLILVDAPCSGEGMFRKDAGAIREWSESNLQLCSERQKRILSDIWDCLKPEGYLIYSTCTYNRGENEDILEWLLTTYPAKSIPILHDSGRIVPGDSATAACYRFYPHRVQGEGFFLGVIQKTEGEYARPRKPKKTGTPTTVRLPAGLQPYISDPDRYTVYENGQLVGIIPSRHAPFIRQLQEVLQPLYQGCELAEVNNRKFRLQPALALSQTLRKENCPVYEADRNTALTFLKKEDIPNPGLSGDWILVSYRQTGLGWCKNLGNRLNNYYPKEWRIRMDLT